MIQIPVERLRAIVAEDMSMSDVIIGAFIARRSILIDVGAGIKLIGSRFSPDSRRLREFLARNRMPHQWIDLEEDAEAEALLAGLAVEPDQTPVVIAGGGEILRNPTNAELGEAIGLGSTGSPPDLCDVVVVGSGPAGLAAALYAASEGLDVQGVEATASGGQAGTSARIENYLGFPAGVSGSELTQRAGVQAAKFGARLAVPAAAAAWRAGGPPPRRALQRRGRDGEGACHCHRGPVPAPRRAPARGVRGRRGLLRRHPGGGSDLRRRPGGHRGGWKLAGQAAVFLSGAAAQCRLLIRGGDLSKSMSRYLVDQIDRNSMIEVMEYSEVVELGGDRELETVTVADNRSGERTCFLPGRCSCSSARPRTRNGSGISSPPMTPVSCSPAETFKAPTWPSSAASGRCSSRRAALGSSRPVTCAQAR